MNAADVEKYLRSLQAKICASLEEADGVARFKSDPWTRKDASGDNKLTGGGGDTRVLADGAVFEWEFERSGKSRKISVSGRIMVNDPDLAVRAAVDGLGIAYTITAQAEPFLRSGQLVRVLEDWSPSFGGLFLYYPSHRQVPAALRALIEMIRPAHGLTPVKGLVGNPFTAD